MTFKRWIIVAAAAVILPSVAYWMLPGKITGREKMFQDIAIAGRIHSSPVVWREGSEWAFALVVALGTSSGTAMQIGSWSLRGTPLKGFPLATRGPEEVPPGNQILGGPTSTPVWMDRSGRLHGLIPGQVAPGGSQPTLSLIAAPPAPISDSQGKVWGWVALATDMQPMLESRDVVAVFDGAGRIVVGYPAELATWPENQSAVVDPRGEFVWVMLKSGQVDAFRLADGRRAAGYPTAAPGGLRPTQGYRLAISPDGQMLYVALGTAELLAVTARTGQTRRLAVANAKQITAVAYAGDKLCALDEGTGRLLTLDGAGREVSTLSIGDSSANLINNVVMLALPGKVPGLLILSVPQGDEQAQIEKLYAERTSPGIREVQSRLMAGIRRDLYGTRALTNVEERGIAEQVQMAKRDWLEQSMGIDALSGALAVKPVTRVLIVRDEGAGWLTLVNDSLTDATPGTSFRGAPIAYPTMFSDSVTGKTVALLPLNAVGAARASVRIYTLN